MIENPIPKHAGDELPERLTGLPPGDLLLGYQNRALAFCAAEALLVIEKSRRIGLTWALAAHAVLVAGAQRSAGGKDALYISYSQEMTREFVDACAMWSRAFAIAAVDSGEFLFDDQDEHGDTRQIKAFRISFASGFEIVALSSAPRSLRGKQGLLIVDEAAFVDSLQELLKAAMAFLIWGGQVVVVSTHDGADNPFNRLIEEIKAKKRRGGTMKISFADAVADGLYERVCLVSGKTPTPEGKVEWVAEVRGYYGEDADEELDCIPKAGSGAFISGDLVAAAEHDDAGKSELYKGGLCVGGRDVSRRVDLSPMWVFELAGDVLWLRERRELRRATFAEQDEVFDGQFKRFRILRYGIDQTGMGEKVVEDAQKRHGPRVEGVLFTPANRLDMAIAMKKRFEQGAIRIPADPAVRADIRAIKRVKGAGDSVRLVNDDSVHADIFWAIALACLMAEGTKYEIAFQTAGERPGMRGEQLKIDEDIGFGIVSADRELSGFI